MGRRKPYPHEEIVQELREIGVSLNTRHFISDDVDMYYVDAAGYSPIERQMEQDGQYIKRTHELAEHLVEIGNPAAEAVALGLRMMGYWRKELLPYARKHRKVPVIRKALKLVAKRMHDPLTNDAISLITSS